MQVDSTRMYRVGEVAEHFRVSDSMIYRAIKSGQLGAVKVGAGKGAVRVPGTAVLAYTETCGQPDSDAAPPSVPATDGLGVWQVDGEELGVGVAR